MTSNRVVALVVGAAQIAATFGVGLLVLLAAVLAFPVAVVALGLFCPFHFGLEALSWCRVGWAIRIQERLHSWAL